MALAAVETLSDEDQGGITSPNVPTENDKLDSSKAPKAKEKAKSESTKIKTEKPKAKAKSISKGGGKGSKTKALTLKDQPESKPKAKAKAALKRPASATAAASAIKRPAATRDPDRVSTGKGLYKNGVWGIKLAGKEIIRVAWCQYFAMFGMSLSLCATDT